MKYTEEYLLANPNTMLIMLREANNLLREHAVAAERVDAKVEAVRIALYKILEEKNQKIIELTADVEFERSNNITLAKSRDLWKTRVVSATKKILVLEPRPTEAIGVSVPMEPHC